ncbi:MAG: diaminopimelate epimerase [Myxococcota bacterium]|jgi:diaminopimelate epimerase|nr:diaminopimelate epimerase [Myxococcota bacterium]
MRLRAFVKYHGLGNDFVIARGQAPLEPALVQAICERRLGVGADGVLLSLPTGRADCAARMLVLNADGSRAQMCGNGLRCFARYLVEEQGVRETSFKVETDVGALAVDLVHRPDEETSSVDAHAPWLLRVELGHGRLGASLDLELGDAQLPVRCVDLGNPHAVAWLETADPMSEARRIGQQCSEHPLFPERANIGFARWRVAALELVVYERGCGITLACGTGAAAAALVARARGFGDAEGLDVLLPGGLLRVEFGSDGLLRLLGPAVRVFSGEWT